MSKKGKKVSVQIEPGSILSTAFGEWFNLMVDVAEKLNQMIDGGVSIGFHDHPDAVVITTWLYWQGRPVADIWFDRKLKVRIFWGNDPRGPESKFPVINKRGIMEELSGKLFTVVANERNRLTESLNNLSVERLRVAQGAKLGT